MTRITGKTVNADLDQDVITFQIGGVERGRITGSSNTLGGGFEIGSSYLYAYATAVTGTANGNLINPTWNLIDSDDSDLAIVGGDPTLIEFLTDGWYIKLVSLFVHSTDVFKLVSLDFGESTTLRFPLYWDAESAGSGDATRVTVVTLTTEPTFWAAGQKLIAEAECKTNGATWDLLGGDNEHTSIRIVRVS